MANSDMLVRVMADTKNYNANLAQASKTLSNFAKNNLTASGAVKQVTSAMTAMAAQYMGAYAAIRGMQKVVGDMVSLNMQFEQSTANLASIMGKSTEEISALTEQAKQLGATTRYTANEITELQTNLARLGFTQQEILNSTSAVQALATATGADLGEAANLAGAALRGFGLNATEMERVASVLSVSTTKSALSFEKLATAVPIVAPVAKQFGFTIEDTVTLLAKLSDAGMDASTAATATRNIFLKMADGSGKLSQAMGRPVHSVEEFGEALAEMREKGMSLNDILNMVGVRSTAAFAVFADNAGTLKDFKDSITDCSEAMHDMEAKQLNTLQGSLTILQSAYEGLMLTFSESNGTIKTVVDSLTELLGAWTKWRQRNQGGDAAIKSYELEMTEEQKKGAKEIVKGYRAGGASDAQILDIFTKEKEALENQRDEMQKVYDEYTKVRKENGLLSEQMDRLAPKIQKAFGINFDIKSMGRKQWNDLMASKIAPMNDDIKYKDYLISMLTPAPTETSTSGSGGGGLGGDDQTKLLKAQYEEQEKAQIASLDRMAMNEADYEASVYKIKRETLQKIADLYQEETAEKARANAAISQLDIAYQGTQIRLANRSNRGTTKAEKPQYTGYGDETMASISARISYSQQRLNKKDIGSEGYLLEADKLVDLKAFQSLLQEALANGMNIEELGIMDKLTGFEGIDFGVNIPDEEWEELVEEINQKREELGKKPIKLDIDTGAVSEKPIETAKATEEGWKAAANAVSTVGGALQQIEDPGAKVAGIIAQAVANVALSLAEAMASPAVTSTGWGWLGFAAAGIATMIGTIASIKSVTGGFANGGKIPGNSYSGDNMRGMLPNGDIVGLDAGEIILNRAQQGVVAGAMQGGATQNIVISGKLSGRDILLSANNDNRARGGQRGFYSEIH